MREGDTSNPLAPIQRHCVNFKMVNFSIIGLWSQLTSHLSFTLFKVCLYLQPLLVDPMGNWARLVISTSQIQHFLPKGS